MKNLTGVLCFLTLSLWSCDSQESKKQSETDDSFKTEILENDSVAVELEAIESDLQTATEDLENALNDLDVEQ